MLTQQLLTAPPNDLDFFRCVRIDSGLLQIEQITRSDTGTGPEAAGRSAADMLEKLRARGGQK